MRRDSVANVSHELKTPVGALRVLAETMAEADDPAELAGFTDGIVRETDRLARLVDQLLELTAIESRGVAEPVDVDLPGVLAEAVERGRPLADEHGVILRVEERVTGSVTGDREQLVRALTHLLDNAVKFSEPAMTVEVAVEDAHGWTAVTVRDQGVGIPSRDLGRVFERFFRVDRARAQTTKGLGLGLSIVRHVARAHGGDITIDSAPGQGTPNACRSRNAGTKIGITLSRK